MLWLILVCIAASLAAQTGLVNPGFEEAGVDGVPIGWTVSAGLRVKQVGVGCKLGRRCLEIQPGNQLGWVEQNFDADKMRGLAVKFLMPFRVSAGAKAALEIRGDGLDGKILFRHSTVFDPAQANLAWGYAEIDARVPKETARLNLKVIVSGGSVLADDVSVFNTPELKHQVMGEGSIPLSPLALSNLVSFAKVVRAAQGLEVANPDLDWAWFVIEGVRKLDYAATTLSLAKRMNLLFEPYLPAVRVYSGPLPKGLLANVQRIDLGRGMTAILPRAKATPGKIVETASQEYRSGNERPARLAGVILLWSRLNEWGHDTLPKFLQQAAVDHNGGGFQTTLSEMMATRMDPFSQVASLYRIQVGRVPLGVEWAGGKLIVKWVGAKLADKVKVGDKIEQLNGVQIELVIEERERNYSAVVAQGRRQLAVREALSGRRSEPALLRLEGGKYVKTWFEDWKEVPLELEPGYWYADLTRMDREDWAAAILMLQGARGVILDGRGHWDRNFDLKALGVKKQVLLEAPVPIQTLDLPGGYRVSWSGVRGAAVDRDETFERNYRTLTQQSSPD